MKGKTKEFFSSLPRSACLFVFSYVFFTLALSESVTLLIPKVVNLKKIKYKWRGENSHGPTKHSLEAENYGGKNMEKHVFKKKRKREKANDMLHFMR